MTVLKLTLEYDGTDFVGWQMQPNGRSVQQELERGIERLCGEPVRVTGAGRTDAGVHARGQVASLRPPRELPLRAWTAGLNALLPDDVACVRAEAAPEGFDARRWARGKRYTYAILETPVRSPLERGRAWEIRRPLDVDAMRRAAPALLGVHDFSAFRAADCPARTTVREMRRLEIGQNGSRLELAVEATAFLKHMVRTIVGTLVEVGHGRRDRAPSRPDPRRGVLPVRERGSEARARGRIAAQRPLLPGWKGSGPVSSPIRNRRGPSWSRKCCPSSDRCSPSESCASRMIRARSPATRA